MMLTRRCPVGLVLTFLLLTFSSTGVCSNKNNIHCYQCAVNNNDLCTDEFLKECPANQAYDRCMTIVRKTAGHDKEILKRCALGPCSLSDPNASGGLGMDQCDRSKEEYDCYFCCQGDGCNKDGASNAVLSHFLYTISLLAICFGILS